MALAIAAAGSTLLWVVRAGGEEFVVVLPETDTAAAATGDATEAEMQAQLRRWRRYEFVRIAWRDRPAYILTSAGRDPDERLIESIVC